MNAKDVCLCGHGREWHDSCSKCACPFFCAEDAAPADVKLWRRVSRVRS